MTIFYLLVFLFGTIIGSFLNCIVFRINDGKSFFLGKSFCPKCSHKLSWKDLIPIFSFIFLKGNCRYCKNKISLQYPVVEFITGLSFVFIFYLTGFKIAYIGNNFQLYYNIYLLTLTSIFIVIFVSDLKHFIIPDKMVYFGIFISLVWYLLLLFYFKIYSKEEITSFVLAGLFVFLTLLSIFIVSRGKWIGFGDVKFSFLMGLTLGFSNLVLAFFLATIMGSIISLLLILLKKKTLKSEIPFGPFLVFGTWISLFFGEQILSFYFNLF